MEYRREGEEKMEENVTVLPKKKLVLEPTDHEGLKVGVMKDGRKYSVRNHRGRFFYPQEWLDFKIQIKPEKWATFDVLINTGARINEALHIRPKDFDWDRNIMTLVFTKTKGKLKEKVGRPRTFKISSQFAKRMKKYIKDNNIQLEEFIFKVSQKAVYLMFKRGLRKTKLNPWDFSLHNVRKTHCNWLKALMRLNLTITEGEICLRLGHTIDTLLKHYGSSNIFDNNDINQMIKILGDLYGLR